MRGARTSARTNTKRKRSLVDESEGCSRKMEQWKDGAYDVKYLTLLDQAISGNCRFGRRFDVHFWDAFTLELNKQIKAVEPDFLGLNLTSVVEYGRTLRNKYADLKDRPNLADRELLAKCFDVRCDHCKHLPKFPRSGISSDVSWGSHHSNTRVSQASSSSSVTSGACNFPERLAALLNNGHLSNRLYWSALDYFISDESSARSWLALSQALQISILKAKFPELPKNLNVVADDEEE